jgi:hypothetical protein
MITINSDNNLTMKGTGKVIIKSDIKIAGTNTILPIECVADFSNVPENLHQIYFEAFRYRYESSSNVYNNTKPEPLTIEEQKREWRLDKLTEIFCKMLGNG